MHLHHVRTYPKKISGIQEIYLSNQRKFQLESASLDDVDQLDLNDDEMTGELGENILGKIIEGRFVSVKHAIKVIILGCGAAMS